MKTELNRLIIFAFMLGGIHSIGAQESTVSSGGEALGGGSVSFSIGQISYQTKSGTGDTITEGVQQPFEVQTLSVKENYKHFSLKLYPNPTRDKMTLYMDKVDLDGTEFKVYNSQGKLLIDEAISDISTIISLEDNPPGTYFLNILKENQQIKSFKVIKN